MSVLNKLGRGAVVAAAGTSYLATGTFVGAALFPTAIVSSVAKKAGEKIGGPVQDVLDTGRKGLFHATFTAPIFLSVQTQKALNSAYVALGGEDGFEG